MSPVPVLSLQVRVPLDRFALEVDVQTRARVTGIYGPSGAGKTTLLETLAGWRRGASGRITCGGEVWLDSARRINLPPEKRRIGYVPQAHLLFPHLDVRGNLLAGARRARERDPNYSATLAHVVEVLDIGHLLDRQIGALSGGERQRIALGRALCSGPRLLLLDEPLAALDGPLRRRILPFLRRVRDAFDLPILIISHQPTELQALCDDLIALREGRVIAQGPPLEVLTQPDLFAQAEGTERFANILPAHVHAQGPHGTTFALGADGQGPHVRTRRCDAPPGAASFLGITAADILLAREAPVGLSARNALPAKIEALRPVGEQWVLTAQIAPGLPPLAVELTDDARHELALAPGERVFLITKSSAWTIYADDTKGG